MSKTMENLFPALQQALAGQYRFERELGHGGMGTVILARDVRLDRSVALKVLPTTAAEDPDLHARFLLEARTAGQLSHPNIVPVFRADELGGHAFFAMPFVDGEDMGKLIYRDGAIDAANLALWLREVAWALAYAHARGVVHRDIKPENIMIETGSARALVTDFGLARSIDSPRITGSHPLASRTRESEIVGSTSYMSPEQITALRLDGRSDLYSLGVVGFQALTGRLPFEGALPSVLMGHVHRTPPTVHSVLPSAPGQLASVIDRCLRKDPAERYQTGEELADALEKAMRLMDSSSRYRPSAARRRWEIVDEVRHGLRRWLQRSGTTRGPALGAG